ncbi:MAG: multiheme c-type cytochrome [Nitrospiraceae bacterium]
MMRWTKWLIGPVVLAGAVYVYYTETKPVVIFGLRSDYAHAIPFQKVPEGLTSLKAESCGSCHREIYEEWKSSIHAHAYEDPFFQAYLTKDKNTFNGFELPYAVGKPTADARQGDSAGACRKGSAGTESSL